MDRSGTPKSLNRTPTGGQSESGACEINILGEDLAEVCEALAVKKEETLRLKGTNAERARILAVNQEEILRLRQADGEWLKLLAVKE